MPIDMSHSSVVEKCIKTVSSKCAEEYGTLCYSMHKQVAQSGKKLLSLLQGN